MSEAAAPPRPPLEVFSTNAGVAASPAALAVLSDVLGRAVRASSALSPAVAARALLAWAVTDLLAACTSVATRQVANLTLPRGELTQAESDRLRGVLGGLAETWEALQGISDAIADAVESATPGSPTADASCAAVCGHCGDALGQALTRFVSSPEALRTSLARLEMTLVRTALRSSP